jgi:hypothetical protein
MYFIPRMVQLIFGGLNIYNNNVLPLLLCTLWRAGSDRKRSVNVNKCILFLKWSSLFLEG